MSKKKMMISLILFVFAASSSVFAQKEWSAWKEYASDSRLSYRISFAKADEVENKAGYYVEIRNESENRVWFTFILNPEADENGAKSKTTLKPATKSVIGIYWTKAVIGTVPTGQFLNVKFEPVSPEKNLVNLNETASVAR